MKATSYTILVLITLISDDKVSRYEVKFICDGNLCWK